MKKLFLGLIATVMFCFAGNAQTVKPSNKIATSVVLTAKFHAVITFLESKDYYKAGISREDFVKIGLTGVTDKKLVSLLTPYMQTIYSFHTQKLSADNVYDRIDGSEFANTVNALRLYEKEGGTFPPLSRGGWLNAIRKFFDWLDDTLGGVIDPAGGN